MASNSTSTDTVVPSSTPTQAPTTSASSSSALPTSQSSSSIANPSPPSVTTESATSSSSIVVISSSIAPSTPPTISTAPTPSPDTPAGPPPPSSTLTTTSTTSNPAPAPTIAPATPIESALPPTVSTITSTDQQGLTVTVVLTSTQTPIPNSRTISSTTSSRSGAATAGSVQNSGSGSSGLSSSGTIAIAVVVPIVAVALLIAAGLFFWRKRKARKDAEELRRKEVEEYGYNPNNDPTLPAVGGVGGSAGHDGSYEMREDGSSGYRGWGTTAVGSTGRKASTTVSGGQSAGGIGMAYSEGASPTHGPVSDTRSDNALIDGRATSPEAEALGAMGPAASANRTGDINRGPSNASSSYSAANRSDGSGDVMGAGGQYYSNQYDTGNPYGESQYGSPPGRAEMPAQPVIRDVQARRNTRIENPSHFPQQSAGISQNF
ncbi:uncharacterized protein RAG0_17393 [Rhynchosporium agropyri]|uniref:Uncharacterized protein n=1 Tax=Rhynchosporium agropyri TaxID=914238 RepID=A0A1E1LTU4_9HELO|nr:uncharacterized protein RAG0_17393 [Rhynchosporium agropyri]